MCLLLRDENFLIFSELKFFTNKKMTIEVPKVKLNTGYEIPLVGLGTYGITDQKEMDTAVDAAMEAGYRLFDTARIYGNEDIKNLHKHGLKREDIFITTKHFPLKDNNSEGFPKLIDESLKNLKTSYIDLVYIHYPTAKERENNDPENAKIRREVWLSLEKLSSKIHSVGVSNYEIVHIEEISKYSTKLPAANQVEYTPHFRRQALKDYCNNHGIFFQAFGSLGRQNPELLNDDVITKLAKKYQTTPQVTFLFFIVIEF